MDEFSAAEVRGAVAAGAAMWAALASDDDRALAALLQPLPLGHLGSGPGLASRLRDHFEVSVETCANMGLNTSVDVLEGRQVRLVYAAGMQEEFVPAGVPRWVWRIELSLGDDGWSIDPIRRHVLPAIGSIDLMSLMPPDEPGA